MDHNCYNVTLANPRAAGALPPTTRPRLVVEHRMIEDEVAIQSPFTRALERYRHLFFALLTIPFIAGFNGQWRIGLDSAVYRGLAESLSAGRGYTFGGLAQHQVYPGLPVLLSLTQRLTGSALVVPLVLMTLASLLTVVLTYQLMLTRFPRWVAVVVTCGVMMNARFVQQSGELMTDAPFLLGVVASLLGWERLQRARPGWGVAGALVVLLLGLALAASMRPTFWVLAIAWGGVCLWRIIRHRDRRAVLALGALAVVWVGLMWVDPRFTGMNVFKGVYEREALDRLLSVGAALRETFWNVISRNFTEAFFNEPAYPFGPLLTLMLLGGALILWIRLPLWGLPVFLIFGVTLVMSDVPRYYLMVLPMLWLAYVLMLARLVRKLPQKWATIILFAAFSLGNFLNLAGVAKYVYEQRHGNFLAYYKKGDYVDVIRMAGLIRQHVAPGERVIGPYASILTYYSGRTVMGGKELLALQPMTQYPRIMQDFGAAYLVGPSRRYYDKDMQLYRMLDRQVVRPGALVAKSQDMWLARAEVIDPPLDWRELPDGRERKAIRAESTKAIAAAQAARAARAARAAQTDSRPADLTPTAPETPKKRRKIVPATATQGAPATAKTTAATAKTTPATAPVAPRRKKKKPPVSTTRPSGASPAVGAPPVGTSAGGPPSPGTMPATMPADPPAGVPKKKKKPKHPATAPATTAPAAGRVSGLGTPNLVFGPAFLALLEFST